jgi:sulfur transfer complex TusBCD TusB component (DsrH family)
MLKKYLILSAKYGKIIFSEREREDIWLGRTVYVLVNNNRLIEASCNEIDIYCCREDIIERSLQELMDENEIDVDELTDTEMNKLIKDNKLTSSDYVVDIVSVPDEFETDDNVLISCGTYVFYKDIIEKIGEKK